MFRALVFLFVLMLESTAAAKCIRLDLSNYQKNHVGDMDGPGSFGKLQDTVTLDCLRFIGSDIADGKEYVLIKDETGVIHRLTIGGFMGENTGQIKKIDARFIYIEQMIKKNGEWMPLSVKFNKVR